MYSSSCICIWWRGGITDEQICKGQPFLVLHDFEALIALIEQLSMRLQSVVRESTGWVCKNLTIKNLPKFGATMNKSCPIVLFLFCLCPAFYISNYLSKSVRSACCLCHLAKVCVRRAQRADYFESSQIWNRKKIGIGIRFCGKAWRDQLVSIGW
jgi:hypothetical protein